MLSRTGEHLRVLFTSPEQLEESTLLGQALKELSDNGELTRVVFDEAHCVSEWGQAFRCALLRPLSSQKLMQTRPPKHRERVCRPTYRTCAAVRKKLPGVPFMALTASATPVVLADIQVVLQCHTNQQGCAVYRAPSARPNLTLRVVAKMHPASDSYPTLATLLQSYQQRQWTGIIYVSRVAATVELVDILSVIGVRACAYHARMSAEEKQQATVSWVSNEVCAIVATVAFGLGIDKPDVRFVVHWNVMGNLSSYYQEVGRAGRCKLGRGARFVGTSDLVLVATTKLSPH